MRPSHLPDRAVLALATVALLAGCSSRQTALTASGVSHALARRRAEHIRDVRYDLTLDIPKDRSAPIVGMVHIRFAYLPTRDPLIIDFVAPLRRVQRVMSGDMTIEYGTTADHILIPPGDLHEGENEITVAFTAGDESLNRNPDFLYTLFVPDRARYAFPVFDQPDLKARVTLTLQVPAGWVAVANGAEETTDKRTGGPADTTAPRVYHFAKTPPIPTYLIAFAAGRFTIEEADRGGRHFRMFHRETDTARVRANRDAIFDLQAKSLAWLEDYTGIPFPFPKFDFFAVPAFQYGGMEHPGAVFYRASSLFLEPTATQSEVLGRASLIAHETAHMWFGDLVTMRWFNDVWMKEVFANFMAAKVVNPSFPEVNHDLRFLLAHYPPAYAVDRTAGANAIRQPLDNLREAGSLYGAIIYQKAPIMMRHLEQRLGEETFRDGLRRYLKKFRFGNATWADLIAELDSLTPDDLGAWSDIWVESPGRPTVTTELDLRHDTIRALGFRQNDPDSLGRLWPQRLSPVVVNGPELTRFSVDLKDASVEVPAAAGLARPWFVLANGDGLPYGDFKPDSASLRRLVTNLSDVHDEVVRAAGWLTLWDAMLDGRLPPIRLIETARGLLQSETTELTIQRTLTDLGEAYWRYLPAHTRDSLAPVLERLIWGRMRAARSRSLKAAYFRAYRSMARSANAVSRLERLWRGQERIAGLPLAERDFTALALQLAVRDAAGWQDILLRQRDRITNPDRRARFEFVMPAVSADTTVRDSVFRTLRDPQNREHEPWVLEALGYLHHPLRAARAERYILPSLELLEEIQQTGDIFFPLGWLNATLGGHNTPSAARIVRDFLDAHPDYPARLRGKILQAADELERSAKIVFGEDGMTGWRRGGRHRLPQYPVYPVIRSSVCHSNGRCAGR